MCDESKHGVTALAFSNVRSDLLAFANQHGDLFILHLSPNQPKSNASTPSKPSYEHRSHREPSVLHCSKIHALRVTAIDWSFDNSQLFSVGDDGGVCFFDTTSGDCIRSIATRTPLTSCRLHRTLPNLSFIGNMRGAVEVHNCSSGTLQTKVTLPGAKTSSSSSSASLLPPPGPTSIPGDGGVKKKNLNPFFRHPPLPPKTFEVTAIEVRASQHPPLSPPLSSLADCISEPLSNYLNPSQVSNHHLFVGDSLGFLHLFRADVKQDGQLQKLVWCMKLRVPPSGSNASVTGTEFVPFCRTTDTPILLCTCSDGTFAIVRVLERNHKLDLHLSSSCVYPEACRAVVCPLSAIQDIPRLVTGSSDGNVYILDLASSGTKPFVVSTLRGHRAPVLSVGISFDESFLASGSADGTLIVWRRSTE